MSGRLPSDSFAQHRNGHIERRRELHKRSKLRLSPSSLKQAGLGAMYAAVLGKRFLAQASVFANASQVFPESPGDRLPAMRVGRGHRAVR
jgi:hypothetical protein